MLTETDDNPTLSPAEMVASVDAKLRILAARVAKRSRWAGDADDFYQEAWLGAMDAAKRYDPSRNASPATFIIRRAWGRMADYVRESSFASRTAVARARREGGEVPRVLQFGTPKNAGTWGEVNGANRAGTNETADDSDPVELADDTEAEFRALARRLKITLLAGDAAFLAERFGGIDPPTLKAMAARHGRSESRFSQIQTRILDEWRNTLTAAGRTGRNALA